MKKQQSTKLENIKYSSYVRKHCLKLNITSTYINAKFITYYVCEVLYLPVVKSFRINPNKEGNEK